MKSLSRQRAGRKSWNTRVGYNNAVVDAANAIANAKWKYDSKTTDAFVIERTAKADGAVALIGFSQAYGELSGWLGKSFANISEMGLSDMLAETFLQGASIQTLKAEYRLRPQPETETKQMMCLSDRKPEFVEALKRGEQSDLEVYADFEPDSFVVVNNDNGKEYRVNLKSEGGQVFASCECADHIFRKRVCKHIGAVLTDTVFGLLAKK